MNEIITMKREDMLERLDEFFDKQPEHVFILDLVPTGESTIFCMYSDSEFLMNHTFATFLDNIKTKIPKEGEQGVTHDVAEEMQNFIFRLRNLELDRDKRMIVTCKDGRSVSGAVAQWAMEWLMDGDESEFNRLNPDIKPNEFLQYDLYLHPII